MLIDANWVFNSIYRDCFSCGTSPHWPLCQPLFLSCPLSLNWLLGFFIGQLRGSQLFWAKHMFCGNHGGSPSIHGTIQRKSVGQRLHPFDLVTRHSKSQSSPRQSRSAQRFRQSPCRGDLNEWQTTFIDTLWMPFTYIIILSFRYLWDTL